MTYIDACGELWNGLLSDGTFDLSNIQKMCKECYGYEVRHLEGAITDLIHNIRKNHWRKINQPIHNGAQEAQSQCEISYTCHFKYPICDTYVFRVDSQSKPSSDKVSPYSPIVEEFRKAAPNRLLVLTFSNCKDMERCTKEALDELGFEPYPHRAYKSYGRFSRAAKAMIQDSIEYFEAPCVKLFEHLEQLGFSGDHI